MNQLELEYARKRKGKSKEDMAAAIGKSVVSYGKKERGEISFNTIFFDGSLPSWSVSAQESFTWSFYRREEVKKMGRVCIQPCRLRAGNHEGHPGGQVNIGVCVSPVRKECEQHEKDRCIA